MWGKRARFLLFSCALTPLAWSDCTAERDCAGCNPPGALYVSCKCPAGKQKCLQCQCTDPQCESIWQAGSCCCERAGGTSCVNIQCDKLGGGSPQAHPVNAAAPSPQVTVAGQPGIKVEDVRFELSGNELREIQYRLRNEADKELLAIEVWWTAATPLAIVQIASCEDGLLTNRTIMPPGASDDRWLGVRIRGEQPISIISASVVFVQFADLTALGHEGWTICLRKQREEARNFAARVQEAFRATGEAGLSQVLAPPSGWEKFSAGVVRRHLSATYQSKGATATLEEAVRIAGAVPR